MPLIPTILSFNNKDREGFYSALYRTLYHKKQQSREERLIGLLFFAEKCDEPALLKSALRVHTPPAGCGGESGAYAPPAVQ